MMLVPSHSHNLTFGHIELHMPIGSHCPLEASEVFMQGQTVLNYIDVPIQDTVVIEQVNWCYPESHF